LGDVSKRHAGVQAVNDVSFGIKRGTICALLGGNGAGKTILLSMLPGLLCGPCRWLTVTRFAVAWFQRASHVFEGMRTLMFEYVVRNNLL